MIGSLFCRKCVERNAYFQKFMPQVDWQWMLVLGIVIGAFISSILSGEFELRWLPSRWIDHFGDNAFVRVAVAFVGGAIMGVGARWANGCTSGHGISGMLQLAVSSWIAAACFFIGGIATTMIMFLLL
jgi:uncharacterized membrane protein YedE/YeeE